MKKLLVLAIVIGLLSAVAVVSAHDPKDGRTGRAEVRFLEGMIDHHQMALDMANDCLAKAETETVKTLCQNIIDTQSAEITQMQTWLLEWYAIDYTPMSMGHMMGMMNMDMMSNMQGMSMMDMMHMMMMNGNMGMGMGNMGGMHGDTNGMDMGNMNGMNGMNGMGMGNMGGRHGNAHSTTRHDHPMMMGMMAGFNMLTGVEYEAAWLESMIDHHDDALHMSQRLIDRHTDAHPELLEFAQGIIDAQTAEIDQMEGMITELEAAQ